MTLSKVLLSVSSLPYLASRDSDPYLVDLMGPMETTEVKVFCE